MSNTPAKAFNDAEEHIDSEVKSSDWWWNELVRWLNFVTATMFVTTSISMAAAWSNNCPFFGISDYTHLTNYSGNNMEWPVYLSLRNVNSTN
jgi:hypothetical protein